MQINWRMKIFKNNSDVALEEEVNDFLRRNTHIDEIKFEVEESHGIRKLILFYK